MDKLWEGKVTEVIRCCQEKATVAGEVAYQAVAYYPNNQELVRYLGYRERGVQIGSGTVGSGWNHVLGCRFREAVMHWRVLARLPICERGWKVVAGRRQ